MPDSNDDVDDDSQTQEVTSIVQFRKGGELVYSVGESRIEVPREGEIVRIGNYQPIEDQDEMVFDGRSHIVREVIHQYAGVPVGEENITIATVTVVLDELSEQ